MSQQWRWHEIKNYYTLATLFSPINFSKSCYWGVKTLGDDTESQTIDVETFRHTLFHPLSLLALSWQSWGQQLTIYHVITHDLLFHRSQCKGAKWPWTETSLWVTYCICHSNRRPNNISIMQSIKNINFNYTPKLHFIFYRT